MSGRVLYWALVVIEVVSRWPGCAAGRPADLGAQGRRGPLRRQRRSTLVDPAAPARCVRPVHAILRSSGARAVARGGRAGEGTPAGMPRYAPRRRESVAGVRAVRQHGAGGLRDDAAAPPPSASPCRGARAGIRRRTTGRRAGRRCPGAARGPRSAHRHHRLLRGHGTQPGHCGIAPRTARTRPPRCSAAPPRAAWCRSASAGTLTGLFRRARYSSHPMTEADRAAAIEALAQVQADLDSGRWPGRSGGGP